MSDVLLFVLKYNRTIKKGLHTKKGEFYVICYYLLSASYLDVILMTKYLKCEVLQFVEQKMITNYSEMSSLCK